MTSSTDVFAPPFIFLRLLFLALLLALGACGGGGGSGGSSSTPPPSGGPAPSPGPSVPSTVTVGGTVSGLSGSGLILQNNGGDDLTIATDGSFVFRNAIAAGTGAYRISVKRRPAAPMQTCVVTNGDGTAASSNITNVAINCSNDHARFVYQFDTALNATGIYITNEHTGQLHRIGVTPQAPQVQVAHPTGRFVYMILQAAPDFIYSYAVDATTGALTEIGAPIQVGIGIAAAHIHPSGRYLYLTHTATNEIARFAIGDDGTLSAASPVALPEGSYPYASVMTNDGRYLLVGNSGALPGNTDVSNVAVFAVNATAGTLIQVPGSPFASTVPPRRLVLAFQETFLYVLRASDETAPWAAYRLDSATGALSEVPAPPQTTAKQAIVAHPGLPFIYMAQLGVSRVEPFAIDEASGQLSPIEGGAEEAGDFVYSLEIEPTGRFLYVYAYYSTVCFTIDAATGRLSDRRVIFSSSRSQPLFVKTNARAALNAKFAYAPLRGYSNVATFSVDSATGGLSSVGTPTPAPGDVVSVATDSRARFLYTADRASGSIQSYSIGPDGIPVAIRSGGTHSVALPTQLVMHPSDRFLFVGSETDRVIRVFVRDATGGLAQLSAFATPFSPQLLQLHPDGHKLFVGNGLLLSVYAITPGGALIRQLDRSIDRPTHLASHPNGRFVYVLPIGSNFIRIFNSTLPENVAPQLVQVREPPAGIVLEPAGRFAYVLYRTSPHIDAYSVDSTTGALVSLPGTPFDVTGGGTASAIAADATGRRLYVSTREPNGVVTLSVDARTGALTQVGTAPTPDWANSVVVVGSKE
jgi:6-phosphogluconolactonase